jgi:signal transduction histidine kinase
MKFLQRYRTNATAALVLVHIACALTALFALWILLKDEDDPATILISSVFAVLFFEIVVAPFITTQLIEPLRTITRAIDHVSKEPSDSPPPNVNNRRAEKSGLKELVQTVYELAASIPSEVVPGGGVTSFALPLLERLPIGVLALDKQGEILYANQQCKNLLSEFAGTESSPHKLTDVHLLFPPHDTLENWLANCRQNEIQGFRQWQHVANKTPGEDDENRKQFDVLAYYNKHDSYNIETTLVVVDRTEEYRAGDQSMDFIALAAHELRGPITVIRGYLDIFEQEMAPKIDEEEKMLMERLLVSASQLSGYINNILNVARFDRNHLQLHLREESWPALVASYIPDLQLRAHAHNRKLSLKIPANLPTVAADAMSMQEVVTNLIDNAIKYSHDGGEIVVSTYQDGDFVETTVQDFGIGIPESVTGRLFTKFYRSHRSRQAVTGTGLGLYLCKAIVESHGGSIWVRSTEGQGSVFGFRLPTYASVAAQLQKEDNSNEEMIVRGSHGWIKNHSYYRR